MMIQIEEKDYFRLIGKIEELVTKIEGLEGYSRALVKMNVALKKKNKNPSVGAKDFAVFKKAKKKYVNYIADSINIYYNTYKEKPKVVCMSSALFEVLSGGYADPDKSTFANIPVFVYDSDKLDFSFVKERYTFEVKTDD